MKVEIGNVDGRILMWSEELGMISSILANVRENNSVQLYEMMALIGVKSITLENNPEKWDKRTEKFYKD